MEHTNGQLHPRNHHLLHPRRFMVWGIGFCLVSAVALFLPVWALGSSPQITQWAVPTTKSLPYGIVEGPDGNMWFAEYTANKMAKFNPTTHAFTEFPLPITPSESPTTTGPGNVIVGPDNNIWFTQNLAPAIGKMTTSGQFTQYLLSSDFPSPENLVKVGNDIWFTSFTGNFNLGEMDASGTILHKYIPDNNSSLRGVRGMSLGPDGNLWFAEQNSHKIGKFNLQTAAFTEYPVPFEPYTTTAGPDGNVWFTGSQLNKIPNAIGRINPTTSAMSTYVAPSGTNTNEGILSGPNGKIYFSEGPGPLQGIGILDPATGSITEYSTPAVPNGGSPYTLAVGPNNTIWYADFDNGNVIGEMDLGFGATPPSPTPTPNPTPSPTPTPIPSPSPSPSPDPGAPPIKIGICHATGSKTHPYQYIVVDQAALQAFAKDPNDIFGVTSAAECPTTAPSTNSAALLNSDPNFVTTKGSDHQLKDGDVVSFLLNSSASNGETTTSGEGTSDQHTATVKDIGIGYCDLVVQSKPIQVHLTLGQTKLIDVNGNGQPDISVELVGAQNSQADLIFRMLASTVEPALLQTGHSYMATSSTNTNLKHWQVVALSGLILGLVLIAAEIMFVINSRRYGPAKFLPNTLTESSTELMSDSAAPSPSDSPTKKPHV